MLHIVNKLNNFNEKLEVVSEKSDDKVVSEKSDGK